MKCPKTCARWRAALPRPQSPGSRLRFFLCCLLFAASAAAAPDGMRAGWGITVLEDEVLTLAVQRGVRDVVLYGRPGAKTVPGTGQPLTTGRATYEQYFAARQRLEHFGLRLRQWKAASFTCLSTTTSSLGDLSETGSSRK